MGLLDSILGQVTGQSANASSAGGGASLNAIKETHDGMLATGEEPVTPEGR